MLTRLMGKPRRIDLLPVCRQRLEMTISRGDKYNWSLRLTAINVTNKIALYNFLSTFSGTHFLTPRTYTAGLGFHF